MSFQIKDFVSITASQINHARSVTKKITDFLPGSVARTLIEAPAVEIEELYLQMFLGLRDAIPVATFLSFGFERLTAASAIGYVSVSASSAPTAPITAPLGTAFFAADGREYRSTQSFVWQAGLTVVRIPVANTVPGLAGNISEGSITSSPFFDSAFTVSNPAIQTGRDIETDSEREARFAEFITSISRGTVSACLIAARQSVVLDADGSITEYVTRSSLSEDAGHVRIYLRSTLGIPSLSLLDDGQLRIDGSRDPLTGEAIPGYRSAGVRVDVLPMAERAVPLSIRVGMRDGVALDSSVIQSLGDVFASELIKVLPGATLYLGTLVEAMLSVAGVMSIVPVTNTNIVCGIGEALTAGSLTVAAL